MVREPRKQRHALPCPR